MKARMVVVFLLFIRSAGAQLATGNLIPRVRVRVAVADGVCEARAQGTMTGHDGLFAENALNDQCEVDFFNVPEGTYLVKVSGGNSIDADSGDMNVSSDGPTDFEVRVRSNELERNYGLSGSAFISA